MKWLKLALRLILSAFFVVSAISKLQSIESFEVYLYSSTFLNYDMATIVARLIIGAELLIALFLLIKLKFRLVWWLTFAFLLVLSLFLLFQMLRGSDENCFCLGELVDFSPTESLIKNGILLLLLLLIRNTPDLNIKAGNWIFSGLLIVGIAAPLIYSPPDLFVKQRYKKAEHDQQALDMAIKNGEIPSEFVQGKKLLSFYSPTCKFCRMAAKRIGTTVKKYDIDPARLNIVFWGDSSSVNANEFYDKTLSPNYKYVPMGTKPYLKITKGRMPLILLVQDGEVKYQMNYRTIDEKRIEEFLK